MQPDKPDDPVKYPEIPELEPDETKSEAIHVTTTYQQFVLFVSAHPGKQFITSSGRRYF